MNSLAKINFSSINLFLDRPFIVDDKGFQHVDDTKQNLYASCEFEYKNSDYVVSTLIMEEVTTSTFTDSGEIASFTSKDLSTVTSELVKSKLEEAIDAKIQSIEAEQDRLSFNLAFNLFNDNFKKNNLLT